MKPGETAFTRIPLGPTVSPAHNVSKLSVIHCGVDAIDELVLYALDAKILKRELI
jgi:hypothetical protein